MKTLALVALLVTSCTHPQPDWTQGYPPCPTADSEQRCFWDGHARGGPSFVVTDDEVIYIDR